MGGFTCVDNYKKFGRTEKPDGLVSFVSCDEVFNMFLTSFEF